MPNGYNTNIVSDVNGNLVVTLVNGPTPPQGLTLDGPVTIQSTPSALGTPRFGSVTIVASGTAVNLPNAVATNGVVVAAHPGNSALVKGTSGGSVGTSNSLTQTNGYCLAPGATIGSAAANANEIWVNGQVGDVFSWAVS